MSEDRVKAGNMRKLADVSIAAAQNRLPDLSTRERIGMHPGKGHTVLDFGLSRLEERAAMLGLHTTAYPGIEAKARAEFAKGTPLCESPIERAMLAALITGPWAGFSTLPAVVHNASNKDEMLPPGDVVIVPQMAFLRYRLDFGVVVEVGNARRIVCVECDGADWHRDYAKETKRVAYLKSWDIPVFKFTGSELHEDAIAAADMVIAGICQWKANLQ